MMALLTVDHAGCGGDDVVGGGVVVVVVVASGAARLSRSLDFYSTVLNDTCDLVSLQLSGFCPCTHVCMGVWIANGRSASCKLERKPSFLTSRWLKVWPNIPNSLWLHVQSRHCLEPGAEADLEPSSVSSACAAMSSTKRFVEQRIVKRRCWHRLKSCRPVAF